jgi:hypothetical protein
VASPPDNLGYVVASYLIAGAAVGGYVARLFARARTARRRAAAVSGRRHPA